MISNDFVLELCGKLEYLKIEITEINDEGYIIICNGEKNNLCIKKNDDGFFYAYIHEGTILKVTDEWYMELPVIENVDRPVITYINYFSGEKEAVAATLAYKTSGYNNAGIIDVPIDKFNERISRHGFKNIQEWSKKDFIKYKLIKDDHNSMFEDISFELEDFIK